MNKKKLLALVLAALTQLEIAGCAVGESGQRYRRV